MQHSAYNFCQGIWIWLKVYKVSHSHKEWNKLLHWQRVPHEIENHNMHYLRSILKLTKFARIYSLLLNFTIICLWTLALYCTLKKWIAHFRKHQERNWCTLASFRDSIYSMYTHVHLSWYISRTNVSPSDHSKEKERSRGTFCWKYWPFHWD